MRPLWALSSLEEVVFSITKDYIWYVLEYDFGRCWDYKGPFSWSKQQQQHSIKIAVGLMMRGRLTHAWHQKAKYLVNTKRLLSIFWKSCWDIACTYFNVKGFGPEYVRAFISEPGIPNFLTPNIWEEEVVRFIGRFDKPANRISIFYCGITVKQEGLITAFGIPYNYFLTTLHSILPFHFSTQPWRFSTRSLQPTTCQ